MDRYPKVYRIGEQQTAIVYVVTWFAGVFGSVVSAVLLFLAGANLDIVVLAVAIALGLTYVSARRVLRRDKTTSVTLYEDHVEWSNAGKSGSCANHDLTLMFGNSPRRGSDQGAGGLHKDIRFGPEGGPYMWAAKNDFPEFAELVSELQRRRREP